MNTLQHIIDRDFQDTFSWEAYAALTQQQALEGLTSGPVSSDTLVHFTKLNAQRMKRLMKHAQLSEAMKATLDNLDRPLTLLAITETWCGDAVQSLPYFQRMAEHSPQVTFRLMWRDEGPQLIESFLTNGGKAIPIVIALDQVGEVLWHWGPRPAPVQQMVMDYKAAPEPKEPYVAFAAETQKWYTRDKGAVLQEEVLSLMRQAINPEQTP